MIQLTPIAAPAGVAAESTAPARALVQPAAATAADRAAVPGATAQGPGFTHSVIRSVFRVLIAIGNHSPLAERIGLAVTDAVQKVQDTPQPQNFGQVGPGILRGAQPGPTTLKTLQQMGIKTVINLTRESNHDAKWIGPTGMQYVYLPEDPFDAPTMDQALRFLSLVQDPQNQPVFFHCYHGSDRTGTMAAVYRIAHDGWTVEQCLPELQKYGFHADAEQAKIAFLYKFYAFWHAQPQPLQPIA